MINTAFRDRPATSVRSSMEIINYKYPGDWLIKDGNLFKGDKQMDGAEDVVDYLGSIVSGHVTIFKGETRIATTVKNESGQRSVGTKVSDAVAAEVLAKGNNYTGIANVVGQPFHSAYEPIKDASGKVIGMVFVGLSIHELDGIQNSFIMSIVMAIAGIVLVLGLFSWRLI
ncbi:MAG: cache domain-containing protein, partial [Selenomonadaceae bacterium]|nr:cache domain-containing protein [Selenomonadaceae bacterium]